MAIGDVLKQLGLTLGQIGAQGGQALGNAMEAQGNPLAYQEAQENQRQHAQQGQQAQEFQQQMAQQLHLANQTNQNQLLWHEQAVRAAAAEHEERNNQWLAQQMGEGSIKPGAEGDPGAVQIGKSWYSPIPRPTMKVPKEFQEGFGMPAEIVMNKESQPIIDTLINFNRQAKGKQPVSPEIRQQYFDQIDQIFQPQGPGGGITIPQNTLAFRNNNPGNLRFAGQENAIPGEGGFAKFSSPEDGYQALKKQIDLDTNRGLTLGQYISKYAPPNENNTADYIAQAQQATGYSPNVPLQMVDPERLAQFQIKKESGAMTHGLVENPVNLKYNKLYKGQIGNLLNVGDTAKADTLMNTITDAQRKEEMAAQQAGDIKKKTEEQEYADARARLSDKTMEFYRRQIMRGSMTPENAAKEMGIQSKMERDLWMKYNADQGTDFPIPLDGASRKSLYQMEPVLDSLKQLQLDMEPYKNDMRVARFLLPRAQYAFGYTGREKDGTDWGPTISMGEMDRLRGVAQSLAGLRTALPIFEQGLVHTPNFWKDSGKTVNDKLATMINYLSHNIDEIYKYGAKTGVVQQPSDQDIQGILDKLSNMPTRKK